MDFDKIVAKAINITENRERQIKEKKRSADEKVESTAEQWAERIGNSPFFWLYLLLLLIFPIPERWEIARRASDIHQPRFKMILEGGDGNVEQVGGEAEEQSQPNDENVESGTKEDTSATTESDTGFLDEEGEGEEGEFEDDTQRMIAQLQSYRPLPCVVIHYPDHTERHKRRLANRGLPFNPYVALVLTHAGRRRQVKNGEECEVAVLHGFGLSFGGDEGNPKERVDNALPFAAVAISMITSKAVAAGFDKSALKELELPSFVKDRLPNPRIGWKTLTIPADKFEQRAKGWITFVQDPQTIRELANLPVPDIINPSNGDVMMLPVAGKKKEEVEEFLRRP